MAKEDKAKRKRWNHPHFKYAYCIERGGTVYTVIHSGPPLAIKGIKFTAANKDIAMEVLTNRYYEYQKTVFGVDIKEIKEEMTLYSVIKEFSQYHFTKFSKGTIYSYITAFNSYLPNDYPITQISDIRNMIDEQLKTLKHHPNTQLKYLSKLNQLFQYCLDQEYITRNPIITPMKPEPVAPTVKYFARDEINSIVKYFNNYANKEFANGSLKNNAIIKVETNYKQMALLVEFLSYSGLRISEALNLWWNHEDAPVIKNDTLNRKSIITDSSIIVDGKRTIHTKPRVREFPLHLVPTLFSVIENLKSFQDVNENKVFKWKIASKVEGMLREAITDLGLEEGRSCHSLRKTALNYWEKELGIPSAISKYMAGHSEATREKFYSYEPSADDLLNMFNKYKS